MSRLEDVDLNQDLIFTGPVTQEELILTWRKRQQERIDREKAEAIKSEETAEATPETSEESKAETRNRIEPDRIPEPAPVAPLTEGKTESSQLPPHSVTNILRPARLNVDPASFTTDWARRLNMKKLDKPKRPEYVLPLGLEK